MWKMILLLGCSLLAACGSEETSPGTGGSGAPVVTGLHGNYEDLSGLGLKDFVVAALPRLANEPNQSRAGLARALDQKWNLNCNSGCEVSRKDKK